MRDHSALGASALSAVLIASALVAGCSCGAPAGHRRDGGTDGGVASDSGDPDAWYEIRDTGGMRVGDTYLVPDPGAYFHEDPPPSTCYPDGGMGSWPDPPGGTPECPDDRSRQGCRCTGVGSSSACWPGPRRNRMRGICHDGTAECLPRDEFGGEWGPCVGAVLPTPGATRGAAACECFSVGRWAIDNLSPCFVDYGASGVYAVSTFVGAGGAAMCPTSITGSPPPAPQPGSVWSADSLNVDCAGQFHLCYTLRAGNAMTPLDTDCVVAETCVDTWYPTASVDQPLPPLPAWTSTDAACARAFRDTGGYGEMSVDGFSIECDDITDGSGGRYVFNRVNYCPIRCNDMPTLPECVGCMMGGSGTF